MTINFTNLIYTQSIINLLFRCAVNLCVWSMHTICKLIIDFIASGSSNQNIGHIDNLDIGETQSSIKCCCNQIECLGQLDNQNGYDIHSI